MLTRVDRGLLWGAYLLMAGAAAVGAWTISGRPKVEPWVEAQAGRLEREKLMGRGPGPGTVCPDPLERVRRPPPPAIEGDPWIAFITPRLIDKPQSRRVLDVAVLPEAVYSGKADLDGASLAWTLRERQVDLKAWERRKKSPPTGFAIGRDGVRIAVLGPKAASFLDGKTVPGKSHRYSVIVLGKETLRDGTEYPEVEIEIETEAAIEVVAPANQRLRLVGGVDAKIAFLRVETYNRERKQWHPSDHRVRPGEKVPGTGWTLVALRFDGFTLLADVTDADGVPGTLSTKE